MKYLSQLKFESPNIGTFNLNFFLDKKLILYISLLTFRRVISYSHLYFMLENIFQLIPVYGLFILAVLSPGPDFAITVQTSIQKGSRAGYMTALGVAVANGLHILYVSIGVGALVANSTWGYLVLKYFAVIYLIYLSVSCFRAQATVQKNEANSVEDSGHSSAFLKGFLVNAFNPKAIFFWMSYFVYVSSLKIKTHVLIPFVISLIALIFVWFSFVAFVMTRNKIRTLFLSKENLFNKIMGGILFLLALKLVLS